MICEKFLKAERTWDLSVFAKAITNNFFDATNTRLASALTGPINQIRTASANERGVLIKRSLPACHVHPHQVFFHPQVVQ